MKILAGALSAVCGMLAVLAPASSARGQEVGTFINPHDPMPQIKLAPADQAFMDALAKQWKIPKAENGETLYCLWRSPMKTPGAFVDGAVTNVENGRYVPEFYLRVPVAQADMDVAGLTLAKTRFPRVAFLEILGHANPAGKLEWKFVHLVLPPFTPPGATSDGLRVSQVTIGATSNASTPVLKGMPGFQTRLALASAKPDYVRRWGAPISFDRILSGLKSGEPLVFELRRLTPVNDPGFARVRVTPHWQTLPDDLATVERKLASMAASKRDGKCLIKNSECEDGQCG